MQQAILLRLLLGVANLDQELSGGAGTAAVPDHTVRTSTLQQLMNMLADYMN